MSDLARLKVETRDGVVIASVSGEIDASNAAGVGEELLGSVSNEARGFVIDFGDTHYLDSSGIQLLFELAEKLKNRRLSLRIVAPADSFVREVLGSVSIDDLVKIEPDLDRALSATN